MKGLLISNVNKVYQGIYVLKCPDYFPDNPNYYPDNPDYYPDNPDNYPNDSDYFPNYYPDYSWPRESN